MTAQLDQVIHPTHRLRICAMLDAATTVELSVIKETVDLSASALSKQVAALVDAGYVTQERSRADSRRIWLTLTKEGRRAYRGHVRALQAIVGTPPGTV
jgi:DNA-binding MarR family transcriptional regulator